ncbi:MAG: hypothetical protein IJX99_00110 [Clostridia bacterium]|nr:hypothetical protein [Clostridia bacterium]
MGFLDNFLKKLGASLATRYGVVSGGKYEGCHIALGNPPKEKVSTAYSFSQLLFLKDKEEVVRFNIATEILDVEYIETIQFEATGKDGYRCKITFPDGDTCEVDLFPSRIQVLYNNLKANMLEETRKFFEKEIENLPQV